MTTIEYPYKPRAWVMVGVVAFFALCGAVMAYTAITNDRGLILDGIPLSPRGATIFYSVVASLSVLLALAGLAGLVAGLTSEKRLRLTPTELHLPGRPWSRTTTVVPLGEIVDVGLQSVHKQRFLMVRHRGGTLSIAESLLPGRAAFEEVGQALVARMRKTA